MNNWFAVGEEIIISCPNMPEWHGKEAIIILITPADEYVIDPFTGDLYAPDGEIGFYLNNPLMQVTDEEGTGTICWLAEHLRKKHKPADESFKDLMQNIKSDVRIVEGVV